MLTDRENVADGRVADKAGMPCPPVKAYYRSLDPVILWQSAQRPVDWAGIFGRSAPVEVEIGFGNGESLVRRAAENPGRNYVGMEVAWASTKRALRRIAGLKLGNVRILQVDGHLGLEHLFPQNAVQRICSFFPVPWPKDRHENRRLFSGDFLKLANSRLENGGQFQIVTDFLPLLEWIVDRQIQDTGFSVNWREIPPSLNTKYERKWKDGGQDVFYEIMMTKARHQDVPLPEAIPLLVFHLDRFEAGTFSPRGCTGPVTVKFREFLYDPVKHHGMLRALVFEDRLIQDIWIKIENMDDYWHLGLAQPRQVVPTEGVRQAIELACAAAREDGARITG